jgi:hypothetical protein
VQPSRGSFTDAIIGLQNQPGYLARILAGVFCHRFVRQGNGFRVADLRLSDTPDFDKKLTVFIGFLTDLGTIIGAKGFHKASPSRVRTGLKGLS